MDSLSAWSPAFGDLLEGLQGYFQDTECDESSCEAAGEAHAAASGATAHAALGNPASTESESESEFERFTISDAHIIGFSKPVNVRSWIRAHFKAQKNRFGGGRGELGGEIRAETTQGEKRVLLFRRKRTADGKEKWYLTERCFKAEQRYAAKALSDGMSRDQQGGSKLGDMTSDDQQGSSNLGDIMTSDDQQGSSKLGDMTSDDQQGSSNKLGDIMTSDDQQGSSNLGDMTSDDQQVADLGLQYWERFSKEITLEKFKQLRPILEVIAVSLPRLPHLTTQALYDAVRFCGWHGSMRDLETCLEVDLGGYMSNCGGNMAVWCMEHSSLSVFEWLTSGSQAREYYCCRRRGTAMRTAQLIWASPVAKGQGDLERVCGFLNLEVPQGPPASDCLEIGLHSLIFALAGLHEWVREKGRGSEYKWLAKGLLSAFACSGSIIELSLNMDVYDPDRQFAGLAVASAVASWLEPVQTADAAWAFHGELEELRLGYNKIGAEGAKAIASALEPRKNPNDTWVFNERLGNLNLQWNEIGAEGAKAIASALEPRKNPDNTWVFNETLHRLDLPKNGIGAEGAKAIASALEPRKNPDGTWVFNRAMRSLGLGWNEIGDEGAKAVIASAVEPRRNPDDTWVFNRALQFLNMCGNEIGAEGSRALKAAKEPRKNPDGSWVHTRVNAAI